MFVIRKADPTQRIAYGWGSVCVDDGGVVTDRQGDQIDPAELEQAVVEFMLESRDSGVMHEGQPVAKVVASLVTTPDIVKALFGDDATCPIGWIIGVKVLDDATWQRVVSGQLAAFSIQGSADRTSA